MNQAPVAEIKRLLERCAAEPAFIERLKSQPDSAMAEYGYSWDPARVAMLWNPEAPPLECPPPEVVEYSALVKSRLQLRLQMRELNRSSHEIYHRWRERQKARLLVELGQARAEAIVHAPICFELNKGCSVGCWFCGISAPKLSDIWVYNEVNSLLWRQVLQSMVDLLGPVTRSGFCYWATDPLDNPDYEKFMESFCDVVGEFPQSTTALALRDTERTRSLLRLAERRGCPLNRFSILTLKQFLAVHKEFSAEELINVECIPQNTESAYKKANAGKAHAKQAQKAEQVQDGSGTIACVSGFLINMVEGSAQFITPCAASSRWPLGYRVMAESKFTTAHQLHDFAKTVLDGLIVDIKHLARIRLADGLDFRMTQTGAEVSSSYSKVSLSSTNLAYLEFILSSLRDGDGRAEDLALLPEFMFGVPYHQTMDLLSRLFELGLMDEQT